MPEPERTSKKRTPVNGSRPVTAPPPRPGSQPGPAESASRVPTSREPGVAGADVDAHDRADNGADNGAGSDTLGATEALRLIADASAALAGSL